MNVHASPQYRRAKVAEEGSYEQTLFWKFNEVKLYHKWNNNYYLAWNYNLKCSLFFWITLYDSLRNYLRTRFIQVNLTFFIVYLTWSRENLLVTHKPV